MQLRIRTDEPIMDDRMKLMASITDFWDKTSLAWRTIWGPHLHHGYYEDKLSFTPVQAQENMIEKILHILELPRQMKILDVGCGMGGSSLYLAKNVAAHVTGITLSKKQLAMAVQQSLEDNVKNVTFEIDDALTLSKFADESFDVIWSLESCEQFYDKNLFIKQAFRVLKPGGKFMLATWCSDRDEYQGKSASQYKNLCLAFDLPYMPTIDSYQRSLEMQNFEVNQVFDWSANVKQSWDIGLSLVNAYSFINLIRLTGFRAFRAVKQLQMMRDAFRYGRVKYGIFFSTKPQYTYDLKL